MLRVRRRLARALAVRDQRLQAIAEDAAELLFECPNRARSLHDFILVDVGSNAG